MMMKAPQQAPSDRTSQLLFCKQATGFDTTTPPVFRAMLAR